MASFFDKAQDFTEKKVGGQEQKGVKTSSNLGREITRIENAKKEFYKKVDWINPRAMIERAVAEKKTFYGLIHGGENDGEPFFVDEKETTMEIFVGSTGTGKGVYLGNKAVEAILNKKGLIIIDPKQDNFLPQICKEELEQQGRGKDLEICSWPLNFGYGGINESDTYIDIANKLIDALDLTESGDAGVDYYKKNSRVLLKKVLKHFFAGDLGVVVKKEFSDILFHLQNLKEDMEKQVLLEKEIGKMKPNSNLITKYEKRFFDLKLIEKIYWDTTTVETLDSLVKSVAEIAEAGNIFKKYTLQGALYQGKVLYLKVDMLDVSSLKMVKMAITDAIQQSRRKKANCIIIGDELSFYANSTIAGALATVRSFGLKFLLALQDLSQMKQQHIKNAILSNCNVKMFFKISDKETLEYVEKLGGKEAVTAYGMSGDGEYRISQQTEDYLNTTRIRALPRQNVGIVIAEEMNKAIIVRTNYIPVTREFDWSVHNEIMMSDSYFDFLDEDRGDIMIRTESDREKLERYRVTMSFENLLENSELMGVKFNSEEM